MLDNILDFANYWWFRYLMVTELYIVEKWERMTIHVIFAALFCIFWYFNYSVLLSLTGKLFGFNTISDILHGHNKPNILTPQQNLIGI